MSVSCLTEGSSRTNTGCIIFWSWQGSCYEVAGMGNVSKVSEAALGMPQGNGVSHGDPASQALRCKFKSRLSRLTALGNHTISFSLSFFTYKMRIIQAPRWFFGKGVNKTNLSTQWAPRDCHRKYLPLSLCELSPHPCQDVSP